MYFKITDTESTAYIQAQSYLDDMQEQKDLLKQLCEEEEIDSGKVRIGHHGSIAGFEWPIDKEVPEGFKRSRKYSGMITPDKRTSKGKKVSKRLSQISLGSASHFMQKLCGCSGSAVNGHSMTSGMGFQYHKKAGFACTCDPNVWKNAKERDKFIHPDGLEEITHTQYQELVDKMNAYKMQELTG